MKSFLVITALALAAPALAAAPVHVGAELATEAKMSLAKARAIALIARSGKVKDQELEKEKGGSGLRYSFDIADRGIVYEVGVDARTGAVLENAPEGKNPD